MTYAKLLSDPLDTILRSVYRVLLLFNSMRYSLLLPHTKVPAPREAPLIRSHLLNDHFLLLRVHSTFGILRRNRNHAFARRQRRGEVMKLAIVANDRHFPAVDH